MALRELFARLERAFPKVLRFAPLVSEDWAAAFWGLHLPVVQAWLSLHDTRLAARDPPYVCKHGRRTA